MMEIKFIDKSIIQRYKKLNKDLAYCNKTTYWGIYQNNVLIGFAGLLIYKNKAIDKNIFIFPKYRGNGYFKYWLNWRKQYIKKLGINKIEATCTEMSLPEYLKRGAKIIKEYRHYTKVVHENI